MYKIFKSSEEFKLEKNFNGNIYPFHMFFTKYFLICCDYMGTIFMRI